MKDYIEERAVHIANYIIENNATVHKDVAERLQHINLALAKEARKVLDVNKAERHLRGGLATKEKYAHQHEEMNK